MLTVEKKRLIQESLRCLAASHSAAVVQIEETIAVLTNALELGGIAADHAARSTSEQEFLRSPDHDLPIATKRHLQSSGEAAPAFLVTRYCFGCSRDSCVLGTVLFLTSTYSTTCGTARVKARSFEA